MNQDQEMERDLAAWVETLGFDEVLYALRFTCHYFATGAAPLPAGTTAALWVAREETLGLAQSTSAAFRRLLTPREADQAQQETK